MSALETQQLIALAQRELVAAWRARCALTDPDGAVFRLSWLGYESASALLAPRVVPTASQLPISRVFNFRTAILDTTRPFLEQLRTEHLDAVVEVLFGPTKPRRARYCAIT